MCVIHPRSPVSGTGVDGLELEDETTLITPRVISPLPVNSLDVSSLFTDSESRPFDVMKQAQHDLSSWLSSNTEMAAHRVPFSTPSGDAVASAPSLTRRKVPSGAPLVFALE